MQSSNRYETYQTGFQFENLGLSPFGGLRGWQIFCPQTHPPPRGWGQKAKLYLFSESSHVAYQIKADDAGSNMVANILPGDTPSTQGVGSKVKLYLFLKVVMLHIKLKGIENRAPWKQICCHYTHQRPLGWGQKVIFFFSKSGHVAYKIKVEEV